LRTVGPERIKALRKTAHQTRTERHERKKAVLEGREPEKNTSRPVAKSVASGGHGAAVPCAKCGTPRPSQRGRPPRVYLCPKCK
jgi:hypothetical protein